MGLRQRRAGLLVALFLLPVAHSLLRLLPVAMAGESGTKRWSAELVHDPAAWGRPPQEASIKVSGEGVRVEVGAGRTFNIAAASQLEYLHPIGTVQVRVGQTGGQARWFVRLYGPLRQAEQNVTVAIAEDEPHPGSYRFVVDPRLRRLIDQPFQLQLGVEGPAGACALFEQVDFLPPARRSNCLTRVVRQAGQIDIDAVERMPNLPQPYKMIDWQAKARDFDRLVFDLQAGGQFLPLVWLDDSHINGPFRTFGLPSYVGDPRRGPQQAGTQEGVTCLGAVLGASLVGIDKTAPPNDYVAMCTAWFNTANQLHLVLNLQRQETGGSFWYEIWPHIAFYGLVDRYPQHQPLVDIMRVTADRWQQACRDMAGPDGVPDFDHTAFDFRRHQPVDNGRWKEPDAAAGVAWLEFMAWKKFQDDRYLAAAESCLQFLQRQEDNPYYEVLLPYGALAAVRLNAELGRSYQSGKLLDWCFDISDCRGGWGVTVGNWGGYDCDGLVGSIDNRGGYAFAMNTFAQIGALVPVVRYEPRYARAIGKWVLNAANASRYFYAGELPDAHQTSGFWQGDPDHVIAYEGLRHRWQGKSPCATGDPVAMNWGPQTDLGLYGSSYVGMLGSIVRPTNVDGILQLDCLATDFFGDKAYPTCLVYNPYGSPRAVDIGVGLDKVDLYDATSHRVLQRNAQNSTVVQVPADGGLVLVMIPAGAEVERRGGAAQVNGVTVDWRAGAAE